MLPLGQIMRALSSFIVYLTVVALTVSLPADASELRLGAWNIANLHHEDNVPLRDRAQPRSPDDYNRLRQYAASLRLDIAALQEIGSPQALSRVFPEDEYHLIMSSLYKPGDELRPPAERDIYTAFAIRKATFPERPTVEMLDALSLIHIAIDRDGSASDRPTRNGIILNLRIGDRQITILNVHLKSVCHDNSLSPVRDTRRDGVVIANRYDCRTLVAQAMILENWIEQQVHLGRSIIMLGDFNRRLNRFDLTPGRADHFWEIIDDGTPGGLQLRKGPLGSNTTCWPAPHALFHAEHIDFVIFDRSLDDMLTPAQISKIPLPFQDDPDYRGERGQRLSDHCPVVATLQVNEPMSLK